MSSTMLFRRTSALAGAGVRSFSASAPRSVARVTIIGNLGDTPELQQTGNGREILKYSVASNSGPKDNRNVSWFRVASFVDGPRRDFLLSLSKGTMVLVEGDMTMNTFQDAQGQNRSNLNIVQRNIEVLRRPSTEHSE